MHNVHKKGNLPTWLPTYLPSYLPIYRPYTDGYLSDRTYFKHGAQFFRACYSDNAWTAEATFLKLPETKWPESHCICFDFV